MKKLFQSLRTGTRTAARFMRDVVIRFEEENVLTISSGIAFRVLLCMVPFMVVITSLFGIFLQTSYANRHVTYLLGSLLPSQPYTDEIRKYIEKLFLDIVNNRHRFGLLGLAILLWTASSLFGSLRRILNKIFSIRASKTVIRKSIENIVFVIILGLLFLVANVFTWVLKSVQSVVTEMFPDSGVNIRIISRSFPLITSYCAALAMFYVINRFMPDKKIPRKIALIAALTTTSLWWVAGKIFAWYVATFHPFGQVYGAYTFFFVFLLWVYYSSMVFAVGLVAARVVQDHSSPVVKTAYGRR